MASERAPREPAGFRKTEESLFPRGRFCHFCGGSGSYENPVVTSTWDLPYVSEPFGAHRGCAEDYLTERVTEQEMREAIQ